MQEFDKPIREVVSMLPACIGAVLGWLGVNLSKEESKLTPRQIIGSIVLCSFTGGMVSILLNHAGWDSVLASVTGSMVGSSGARGYEWVSMKIICLLESNNKGV